MSNQTPLKRRSLDTKAQQKAETSPEFKALAKEFYLENKAMNAAKKKAEAARKKLFKGMREANITSFPFTIVTESGKVSLVSAITSGRSSTVMDTEAIYRALDEKTFLKIATISKKSAQDECGTDFVEQYSSVQPGTPNVSVSPKK